MVVGATISSEVSSIGDDVAAGGRERERERRLELLLLLLLYA